MNKLLAPFFLLAILFLPGCGLIYTDIRTPYGYNTATPADVKAQSGDETVSGESCNRSVLHLVAWGKGGYAAAVDKALAGRKDMILYDVRSDLKVQSYVLGVYTRTCTVVTGRLGKP